MALIHPFKGCLPAGKSAEDFIAPPYDVVSENEVRKRVRARPFDFLNITRPDALTEPDNATAFAIQKWQTWLAAEDILQDNAPCFYVYRLENEHHHQTGIMACIDLKDYTSGHLKRHELTRPDKETDRAEHIVALSGQLSPVLVCHKPDAQISERLKQITNTKTTASAELDGIMHSIWRVSDESLINAFIQDFQKHELYIADGHHRCAAAKRAAETLANNPEAQQIFAGIFPSSELEILGYHRILHDIEHFNLSEFLGALQELGELVSLDELTLPSAAHQIHFVVCHEFYCLNISPATLAKTMPDALDSAWLTRNILEPILGVEDIRRDPRIGFVGGRHSLEQIHRLVEEGAAVLAFLLYPTSVEELMAVADAAELMPPKSTWFEPKLADGLVSLTFK